MLRVKQRDIKWVFGVTRPGIEPRSLESLVNTFLTMTTKVDVPLNKETKPKGVSEKWRDLRRKQLIWIQNNQIYATPV